MQIETHMKYNKYYLLDDIMLGNIKIQFITNAKKKEE